MANTCFLVLSGAEAGAQEWQPMTIAAATTTSTSPSPFNIVSVRKEDYWGTPM